MGHLNPNNFLIYFTSNFTPIHAYPRLKILSSEKASHIFKFLQNYSIAAPYVQQVGSRLR